MTKEEKTILGNTYYTLKRCSDEVGGMSTQTLRARIKDKELKAYRFTNEFLVKKEDLDDFIARMIEKTDEDYKEKLKTKKSAKKIIVIKTKKSAIKGASKGHKKKVKNRV